MLAIDFMAYARKVQVKKLNLKTFVDFQENLIQTLSYQKIAAGLISHLTCTMNRALNTMSVPTGGININICRLDQPLPIEMDKFWCSSENKANFQMFFIRHIETKTFIPWWITRFQCHNVCKSF